MAKKISKAVQERRRKKSTEVPLVNRNRFEVHQNRAKYTILGRKEKNDRGAPGVSRSKANEKRKKTLLQKYMQRNKSNLMVDKRFGEFDENVSVEEKMLKRFTLEKQSHHVKAGHYSITDDADEEEQLTHYGQNLAEISNFDEIDLESGDEEDDMAGGLLRKKKARDERISKDGDEEDEEEKKLTKKELLHEMIVDSKRDKNERRKTKELAFELTQRLDKEWKDIHSLLIKRSDANTAPKENQDDYDKIVKELVFEAKAKPTERLQSEEEITRKEARRRALLEKERLGRMDLVEEDDEEGETGKHLSADALIPKQEKKVDDRYLLKYKDGEMVMPEGFQEGLVPDFGFGVEQGEEEEEEGEDEEDGEDDEDEESDNEDVFSDDEKEDENENEKADEEEEEDDTDEDESDEDEENDEEKEASSKAKKEEKPEKSTTEVKTKKSKTKAPATNDNVLKIAKKVTKVNKPTCMKALDYSIPNSLEAFKTIMKSNKSKSDALNYLAKVRTTNIANKKNLNKFADLVFDYIDFLCNEEKPVFSSINVCSVILLQLSQDVTGHVTKTIQIKLKSMFNRISACVKARSYSDASPCLEEIVLLKMIDTVYPTSDLSHCITTPALLVVSYILTKTKLVDGRSVACGILLLDIVYNYVKLSKRYLPEVILFLSRVLYEAVNVSTLFKNKFTSSAVNAQKQENGALFVNESAEDAQVLPMNIAALSKTSTENTETTTTPFKLSCLRNLLLVCHKFAKLYRELETFTESFEPVALLLSQLPLDNYPTSLKTLHSEVTETITSAKGGEKIALKLQARKPIPLTLLEPQYDEEDATDVFRKRGSGDKAKNEYDKLKYKVKREMKGAVKEIRKDSQFLAKQQLGEQLNKDATRKRKVKELKNHLENERREIKELERGPKKSK